MRTIPIYFENRGEFAQKVDEVAKIDPAFSKAIKALRKIENIDYGLRKGLAAQFKINPEQIANSIIKKFNCVDFSRIFRIANDKDNIKELYYSMQKYKCFFCEQKIQFRRSFLFHRFSPVFLVYNSNTRMDYGEVAKINIPFVDINALVLICSVCYRASRFLMNYSNQLPNDINEQSQLRIFSNPFDTIGSFHVLPSGEIVEINPLDNNLTDNKIASQWPIIHEMNLNRPQLVNKRKEAYRKTIDLLKVRTNPEQTKKPDKWMQQIFSTQLPYTLARYSALENFFGKIEVGVQTQDGSFQISDFIRAYEYLEEVRRHPKLVENPWRPDLLKKWNVKKIYGDQDGSDTQYPDSPAGENEKDSHSVQYGFDTLQNDFLWWLDEAPLQSQGYLPPHYPPLPMRPPRFIREFSIKNYRGLTIERICLEPRPTSNESDDSQQYTVPVPDVAFLADNAAGKTRLLQALVWALAGCEDVEKLRKQVPEHYLPKGTMITVEFFDRPDKEKLVVTFLPDFPTTGSYTRQLGKEDYKSRIPLLAFGSNRAPATEPDSLEGSSQSKGKPEYFIECAMTLFRRDSHVPHPLYYLPFDKFGWFKPSEDRSIDDELKVQAIRWLLAGLCLPKIKETGITRVNFEPLKPKKNKPRAKLELKEGYPNSKRIPFKNWSEGFQTIYTLALAVIFDMMAEDSGAPPNTGLQTTMSGIVLIDEFDAHLHPRWRVNILKQMKAVFPNVQFIFTTHDPVILRGMPASSVFRLLASQGGVVKPINLMEKTTHLTGFETDDLLVSDLFGLDILRDEEDAEYYERYLHLLLKKAHANRAAGKPERAEKHPELSDEEKTELEFLRRRCGGGYAGLGHPRDQLILPVIDTIYAEYWDKEEKSSKKPGDTSADEQAKPDSDHLDTVKKLLVEIWNR